MKQTVSRIAVAAMFAAWACAVSNARADEKKTIECSMEFSLKGWSAFYKTSKGEGTVECTNGQKVAVTIKSEGGGITFGKSDVKHGTGKFSGVTKIEDVLGSYGYAGAGAAAVKSSEARALTKGEVSLALAGTGDGWDLGVDVGKFTISRAGAKEK